MPRTNSSNQHAAKYNGRITHSYTGPLMPRSNTVAPAPSPAPAVPSSMPYQYEPFQVQSKTGLFQSMKEGFGFGVGTSIARSMFGPSEPAAPPAAPVAAPSESLVQPSQEKQKKVAFDVVYTQCMLEGGSEDFCKQLSDTFK